MIKQTAVFESWFLAESIHISLSQNVLRFHETKCNMVCCMNTEKLELWQQMMKSAIAWSYQTTIFAFRINYFQIFVWTNYFLYRKESTFACWVLRKTSFYVIKFFNYLFHRIIITIHCHNRLFSSKIYHELNVQKVCFFSRILKSFTVDWLLFVSFLVVK